jgi:hypothetical protein
MTVPRAQNLISEIAKKMVFLPCPLFARVTLLLACFFSTLGCGDNNESVLQIPPESNSTEIEEVKIPLFADANSLNLAPQNVVTPESFIVSITGCASGHTTVHNTATDGDSVYLFKRDIMCTAGLRSFTYNSRIYTKLGGGDFSGPGSAIFFNPLDTIRFTVQNPQSLSNPIATSDRIAFAITEITSGQDFQILSFRDGGILLSQNGGASPFLKWFSTGHPVELTGLNEQNIPSFRAKLECASKTWKTQSPLINSTCKSQGTNQLMREYYVRLVSDNYNNGTSLTLAQAQMLFGYTGGGGRALPGGPGVVSINQNPQVFTPTKTNQGGILTTIAPQETLNGCRNYLLIVLHNPLNNQLVSNWSFRYFNLDFATSKKKCL